MTTILLSALFLVALFAAAASVLESVLRYGEAALALPDEATATPRYAVTSATAAMN